MSDVQLILGGQAFGGWTDVKIARGIERAAGDFSFGATDRPERGAQVRIRPQESCEVTIDDELVISGFCDAVDVSFDGRNRTIGVAGRSKTQDAIDCSVANEPRTWRNRTVGQIALDMLQPYGIGLVVDAPIGLPLRKFKAQIGETVFDALDRAAKIRGLLITDQADGSLVITRASDDVSDVALVVGGPDGNVLAGEGKFDGSELYSEYRCKGQSAGSDDVLPETAAHAAATVTDTDFISRFRMLEIKPPSRSNRARCRDLAQFEANVRGAKAIDVTYTVRGWRQRRTILGRVVVGDLWRANVNVPVSDPIMGIETDLLIAEVRFELTNDSGEITKLRLAPRTAYELLRRPDRKPTRGIGRWKELQDVPTGALKKL